MTWEVGERAQADPMEERGEPDYGAVGGKDGRDIEPEQCLNETAAGSGAVEESAADGMDDVGSSH